jgi:hypothetical protein
MRTRATVLAVGGLFAAAIGSAQIDPSKWFASTQKDSKSDGTIVAGLKQALEIGAGQAVSLTGTTDGYFGNAAIKILMPAKLQSVETALRAVGYGPQLDAFVLSMNRAAEKAAPAAKDIFVGAIQQMTFEDARKILSGGDTAATDYFREKTTPELTAAFKPVVEASMNEVGVTKQYKELVGRYEAIPFVGGLVSFDLDQYVVSKALDGLFLVLGDEERKIRKDPAARVTDLLKQVFGK